MISSATTPEKAVELIRSRQSVFIHSAAAAPNVLIQAMAERYAELEEVKIYHLHTEGSAPYLQPECRGSFQVNSFFIGNNLRSATNAGYADYIPSFLSEIPIMLRQGVIPIDVALIQVSPPDRHGYCSLGTSVDTTRAAVDVAKVVIAQVNKQMPRTLGDGALHLSTFDAYTEVDQPLPVLPPHQPTQAEQEIGRYVAELIPNRATLQLGIGSIPNAVLSSLNNHQDLGIHTEMFSDGVIPLVEQGIITNRYKPKHQNVIVSGFVIGSRKLYDFVHDNPQVRLLDVQYVNDTAVIRKLPHMVSINTAIEVDLSGQVSADSIGSHLYSGVGGQMDFIRGASLAPGGKPIIALPSTTYQGESKINPFLKPGAGVVTTRAHVHYVVTEYGIAELYGKNLRERAKSLIKIAHPDHQERLEREAHQHFIHF